MRREFSVSAEGRHIVGRMPKPRAAKPQETHFRAGHYKDLTETGNRARKVSGTQGTFLIQRPFKTVINYVQPQPLPPTKEKRTEVAPSLSFSLVEGRVPLYVDKTVITTLLRTCAGHDTSGVEWQHLDGRGRRLFLNFQIYFEFELKIMHEAHH